MKCAGQDGQAKQVGTGAANFGTRAVIILPHKYFLKKIFSRVLLKLSSDCGKKEDRTKKTFLCDFEYSKEEAHWESCIQR